MIDLHCHILPGLDDGATDLNEALAMACIADADGITTIVATPHYDCNKPLCLERAIKACEQLNTALEEHALPVTVLLGFEILLTPEITNGQCDAMSLGLNGSSYLLFELPLARWPLYLHDSLFRLQSQGARPILAHAERYSAISHDFGLAGELVDRGVRLQINAEGILGLHGRHQRRCAEQLVERGLVSFLASDAHSAGQRAPRLRDAVAAVANLIGREAAVQLAASNPLAVIGNRELPPQLPISSKRPSLLARLIGWN